MDKSEFKHESWEMAEVAYENLRRVFEALKIELQREQSDNVHLELELKNKQAIIDLQREELRRLDEIICKSI